MNNKTIIFDFDGTIADTLTAGITIYNKIAPEFHYATIKPEDIPVLKSKKPQEIVKQYGISKFMIPKLALKIKKDLKKEMRHIKVFPGMHELLIDLRKDRYRLGIMTSNTKENVEVFLEAHDMQDIFEFIYSGKNIFGKSKILKRVIKEEEIDEKQACYVGDETRDIEATKKIHLPIISVSWGFNSRSALEKMEPDYLVDTVGELQQIIKTV